MQVLRIAELPWQPFHQLAAVTSWFQIIILGFRFTFISHGNWNSFQRVSRQWRILDSGQRNKHR